MIRCPEAHLFYSTSIYIRMHQILIQRRLSHMILLFPPSKLRRFLASSLMSLYECRVQQKEPGWKGWKSVLGVGGNL